MIIKYTNTISYSALLVTYKPTDLIYEAVASILAQKIKPMELILINDASDNLDINRVRNLISPDIKFISYRNEENVGASASRNKAVELSSCEFIIFFDDDDVSTSLRSEVHLDAFMLGASVSYVSSTKQYSNGYKIFFENPDIYSHKVNPQLMAKKLLAGYGKGELIGAIPCATLAMRKSAFAKVGGFDPSFRRLEDVDIALRLGIAQETFAWSSALGVERKSTARNDKGGLIDVQHEKKLVNKFQYLLDSRSFSIANAQINLRATYFGGISNIQFGNLTKILVNRYSYLLILTRISRFISRIIHDYRQRKK